MEALTTINQPAEISTTLFNGFISWIDRGQTTTKAYIKNFTQFIAWLKYKAIRQPVREDILAYKEWLMSEHQAISLDLNAPSGWSYRTNKAGNTYTITCKANTIAQYIRIVCQFFRWTASNGYYPNIADNIHAPKIKKDTHRKEALKPAEVLEIEQSILARAEKLVLLAESNEKDTEGRIQRSTEQGKRLYAMYLLAVVSGLRTIEISRAKVQDLESKGGTTYLYVWGKGHSEADTKKPLPKEVAEAIADYLRSRTDSPTGASPLFVSTGNRSKGQKIAPTTISTMLKKAMVGAGYDSERLTAHSLRHTAGTNVQELTGNLYLTQQYMRHSNPATTEIYLHNDTDQQQTDIAQKLYGYYHNQKVDDDTKLQTIIARLTPEKLKQLTLIAESMA